MQQLKNIVIPGSRQKPIVLDAYYVADGQPKPIVIFSHGFKGFKDWGHFDLVARKFAEAGFVYIKFNFSHNGTTPEDPTTFGDLEAFGHNNYIIELDDLKKVMDWSQTYAPLKGEADAQHIYLLGHSRGGGVSIIKAGEDHRIKKLVTWASVSDLVNRNKQKTIETWQRDGVVYARNGRTQQDMPLYYQFYENLMANKERLSILKAVKHLTIPFLIIHGTNDEAVQLHDAEDLHKSGKHSKLFIVENATHTFGVKHPFNGELPADAQEVLDKTIAFFKK